MMQVLEFTEIEEVDADLWLFQTDDGTIFYWRYVAPHRLYVKITGEELEAELPDEDLLCNGTHANAIYFSSPTKIFRAVYTTKNGIEFDFMRFKHEDEGWHEGSLYSREIDMKTYIVRMYDESASDGIPFDVTDDELVVPKLMYVHREKVIYVSETPESSKASLHQMSENVFRVDIPSDIETHHSLHARDSSPFVYISDQQTLYTVNMETAEVLPILRASELLIYYIIGVNHGVITVLGIMNERSYLMTAQFPIGYFKHTHEVALPINENSSTLSAASQIKEVDEYLTTTIADLRKKNAQLMEEKSRLRILHEKEKRELNSVIDEQRTRISHLEQENNRLQKNNNEDTDEMITELRKIISVLSVDCEPVDEIDQITDQDLEL